MYILRGENVNSEYLNFFQIIGGVEYYTLNSSVEVNRVKDTNAKHIDILSEIDGKPVKIIGMKSFLNCDKLESVTIPNTITKIAQNAFHNCKSLKSVYIPDSVTELGWAAFYGCISLTDVRLPLNLKAINERTFGGCLALQQITIPNSVSKIRSLAFKGCSNLHTFNLPNNLKEIEPNAFADCHNITHVLFSQKYLDRCDDVERAMKTLWNMGLKTREVLLRQPSI